MDISKFEYLLTLPLEIKKVYDYGSWRGIYAEPAIFFESTDEYIPISELNEILNDLTSGKNLMVIKVENSVLIVLMKFTLNILGRIVKIYQS